MTEQATSTTETPKEPFRYTVKNREVVKELEANGFTIWHAAPEATVVEGPPDLSHTKAHKFVSATINYHVATKNLLRAKEKYEQTVEALNNLNASR